MQRHSPRALRFLASKMGRKPEPEKERVGLKIPFGKEIMRDSRMGQGPHTLPVRQAAP